MQSIQHQQTMRIRTQIKKPRPTIVHVHTNHLHLTIMCMLLHSTLPLPIRSLSLRNMSLDIILNESSGITTSMKLTELGITFFMWQYFKHYSSSKLLNIMFNSDIMHHDQLIFLYVIDKVKHHNWNHKQVAMHHFQFELEAMIAR